MEKKRIKKENNQGRKGRAGRELKFTFALPPKLAAVVTRTLAEEHTRRFTYRPDQLSRPRRPSQVSSRERAKVLLSTGVVVPLGIHLLL